MRSPTGDADQYGRFSSARWPQWPVPPGYLTAHGYELIKELGAYDREELATRGLLGPDGCLEVDRVSIHADSDQRTRETAKALAEGMFPGCDLTVKALSEGANDPLFHLPSSGVSRADADAATTAALRRMGNDPKGVAAAHRAQLADLDGVLAGCGPTTGTHERTSIFDVPASVDPRNDDHLVAMKGPLNTAGTLTENMLLEYAEGMPAKASGQLNLTDLQCRSTYISNEFYLSIAPFSQSLSKLNPGRFLPAYQEEQRCKSSLRVLWPHC